MRRLESFGWHSVKARKGRSFLTAAGITLGVAVLFGVLLASQAVNEGLSANLDGFTGRADVIGSPGGEQNALLPPDAAAQVAALPQVAAVSAKLSVPVFVDGPQFDGAEGPESRSQGMLATGLDAQAARFRDFPLAEGRLPTTGTEVAVAQKEADFLRVVVGAQLQVSAAGSTTKVPVTVVGVLKNAGAGLTNGGRVLYAPLASVQVATGRAGALNQLDVDLADGVAADEWIRAHGMKVSGMILEDAEDVGAGFAGFLKAIQGALVVFAALALFVGGFLIYLTLSMAVVERTKTFGILASMGAVPAQVRRVILLEAIGLGLVATVAGLLVGLGLAVVLSAALGGLADLETASIRVTPGPLIASVLLGVGATVVAAFLPARRAARLSPLLALAGDAEGRARLSRSWIAGLVFGVLGTALLLASSSTASGGPGQFLLLLGAVLCVPPVVGPLARVLGRVTERLAPGVGRVAVAHLVRERSRSAYTLGLVMVVLASMLGISAANSSMQASLRRVLDRQFGADFQVFADGPIEPATADKLRSTPGVASISPLWFGWTRFVDPADPNADRIPQGLTMIDPNTYFATSGFSWIDGDDASAKAALTTGKSVLVTAGTSLINDIDTGDTLQVETSQGLTPMTVAGIYESFGGGGDLVVGEIDAHALFGAGGPVSYAVKAAEGTDPEALSSTLKQTLGVAEAADFGDRRDQPLSIISQAAVKQQAFNELNGYFSLFTAVLAIAAIVGLLGLANTLAMSVVQRTREIGLLRSVGTLDRQVLGLVLVEASTLVLVAFVLAIPLGSLIAVGVVRGSGRSLGLDLSLVYPWVAVPVLAVLSAVIGALAAIGPGRRAMKLSVLDALNYS